MSTAQVKVALDLHCTLGEGTVWCERRQRLLFTDIERSVLHAWHPHAARHEQWAMPERLGCFALTGDPDRLLLGLASGVALFDLASGTQGPLQPVEADEPRTRINDGHADRQGRFVFGTYNQKGSEAIGHFWRVDGRGADPARPLPLERLPLPRIAVANSTAFSPDGTRMVFTDSPTRTLWCVDYAASGALVGTPRVFARIAEVDGFPDGACFDADGGLWLTLWDGGALLRFDGEGRETERIALPARRPTCPAFGGPGLDTLFVSSACVGLEAAVAAGAGQGGLLAVTGTGRRGVVEPRFSVG